MWYWKSNAKKLLLFYLPLWKRSGKMLKKKQIICLTFWAVFAIFFSSKTVLWYMTFDSLYGESWCTEYNIYYAGFCCSPVVTDHPWAKLTPLWIGPLFQGLLCIAITLNQSCALKQFLICWIFQSFSFLALTV